MFFAANRTSTSIHVPADPLNNKVYPLATIVASYSNACRAGRLYGRIVVTPIITEADKSSPDLSTARTSIPKLGLRLKDIDKPIRVSGTGNNFENPVKLDF